MNPIARADADGDRDAILARLVADPAHARLPALMLVLTVLTGVVDAVSIVSLGRVFVANMTGNVVFVGSRSPAPAASRCRPPPPPSPGSWSAPRPAEAPPSVS